MMPDPPIAIAQQPASATTRAPYLRSLHQRTYKLRVLGMGLASLPLSMVMLELHAAWPSWAWIVFSCLLWPHLAYLLARRSGNPLHAELRNFVIDSLFAGSWAPMMHFNTLPSVMLITTVMADKINTGVRGLWRRSLPGMLLAIVAGGAFTGFAFQPQTSMTVLLATLPIMIIHAISVSVSSYRLVRRVQAQNLQLKQLTERDTLTQLDSRSHWQLQAEALLAQHHGNGTPAILMALDADNFKDINDRYGHVVGDDVLRAVADLIRSKLRPDSIAGRLGGDEFVVAMPAALFEAQAAAERLRTSIEALRFAPSPDLRCSVSIGLAEPPAAGLDLREWVEAADRALYRAKQAGRNRSAVAAGNPVIE